MRLGCPNGDHEHGFNPRTKLLRIRHPRGPTLAMPHLINPLIRQIVLVRPDCDDELALEIMRFEIS